MANDHKTGLKLLLHYSAKISFYKYCVRDPAFSFMCHIIAGCFGLFRGCGLICLFHYWEISSYWSFRFSVNFSPFSIVTTLLGVGCHGCGCCFFLFIIPFMRKGAVSLNFLRFGWLLCFLFPVQGDMRW